MKDNFESNYKVEMSDLNGKKKIKPATFNNHNTFTGY